ncbi:MAG: TetR/AcrR family transcriptional regulator [Gammaproteobacteria bacterium]
MSSLSNSARRSHAERTYESDQKMLCAAVELITEKGLENMTLKSVGEIAGYSRGLAGYRFGSKQGLYEFVMQAIGERWLEQLNSATSGLRGVEAMRAAVEAHCDMCLSNDAAVQAFYILWLNAVNPGSDTREMVINIDRRRQRDVAQWVMEACTDTGHDGAGRDDAQEIATQFSAAIIGIVYHWLADTTNLGAVKAQHEQLIHTMVQLMQPEATS